jgi:hypothetical protein
MVKNNSKHSKHFNGMDCLQSLNNMEAKIVNHLKIVATDGYGYTRSEVARVASDYAVQIRCTDDIWDF